MNDKLKHKIIKYLNREYSGLVRYETDKLPNNIFFMKDGKYIFDYYKENSHVYISYKYIWSFLKSYFGLEYEEIQSLTKEWVEEQFKSDVTTTDFVTKYLPELVEEQFKLDVTTTRPSIFIRHQRVEEQYKLQQQCNS
jgi:ABC-type uncharacterized transport system ATPase subunit